MDRKRVGERERRKQERKEKNSTEGNDRKETEVRERVRGQEGRDAEYSRRRIFSHR